MFLALLGKLDLPRASDLPKRQLYHLMTAYVVISLPMTALLPLWIFALVGLALGLKFASIHWHFSIPKWALVILLLGFGGLIFVNAAALGKEYAALALLLLFASLKLLEAREQRDAFLLMLVNFLLIMGALMAQQSPLAFAYLLGCFVYNIYIQLRIAQPREMALSIKYNLLSIGKISLASLPFVLILFFFFPRLEPLWQMPGPPQSRTGLGDEMTPDSLTELVQDGSFAFRVKFDGDIPANDKLYWRGPVLSDYDGVTWRRNPRELYAPAFSVDRKSKITYTMYHDGSTRQWVVPLDLPSTSTKVGSDKGGTQFNQRYEVKMPNAPAHPVAFSLTSYLTYRTDKISKLSRRENTQLPADIFPQTRALAAQLRGKKRHKVKPKVFVERVLNYFRTEPFFYDLAPPAGNVDMDVFLFDNRIGYCQHFTSAFVFMMRSQGIPARVVTGYQGGELNTVSGDFEVKQLNAHAWAEVYLDGQGWVRFDPTAAVAPDRIQNGTPFGSAGNTDTIAAGARWEVDSAFVRKMATSLRAMNAFWQNWVINYDSAKQRSLWQRLGLGGYQLIAWIILLLVVTPVVIAVVWWYRRRRARNYGDATHRAISQFLRYVDKAGLAPEPAQPLSDWLESNRQQLGKAQAPAQRLVTHYYRLRYHDDSGDVRALKLAIADFIRLHRRERHGR